MSSLVVGIAGYHYWRIFNSWRLHTHWTQPPKCIIPPAYHSTTRNSGLVVDRALARRRIGRRTGARTQRSNPDDGKAHHRVRPHDRPGLPRR